MLWRKKQPDINTLPAINPDAYEWKVIQATHNDAPLIIRLNDTARQWIAHKELGIKLGFAVPLNAPDPGGLPTPDENEQLNAAEDIIVHEVAANAKGIYALVLTTGTMREFVFYIGTGADIGAMHEAIRNSVSTHEVQCQAVMDRDWDAFKGFASE
jgi:hypothetical protein